MNLAEKIAKYGFKVTMKRVGTTRPIHYQIKTDPSPHYVSLAIMLHNDGYEVHTDIVNETVIAKEKA